MDILASHFRARMDLPKKVPLGVRLKSTRPSEIRSFRHKSFVKTTKKILDRGCACKQGTKIHAISLAASRVVNYSEHPPNKHHGTRQHGGRQPACSRSSRAHGRSGHVPWPAPAALPRTRSHCSQGASGSTLKAEGCSLQTIEHRPRPALIHGEQTTPSAAPRARA